MLQTKYTPEEIGRIGTEIYRGQIRPQVMPQYKGKFLILDIESGDYEIDTDDTSATSHSFYLVVVTRYNSCPSQTDVENFSDDFNVTEH
jgi:hypothetical protein